MLWVNLDKLEKKRRAAISGIYAEMDLGPFPCSLGRLRIQRQVLTTPFQPNPPNPNGQRVPCGMKKSHQFHLGFAKTTVLRVVATGWSLLEEKEMRRVTREN